MWEAEELILLCGPKPVHRPQAVFLLPCELITIVVLRAFLESPLCNGCDPGLTRKGATNPRKPSSNPRSNPFRNESSCFVCLTIGTTSYAKYTPMATKK